MKRETKTPPPPDELQALRDSGLNREEIAAHYGVSLTTVKRWISIHKITKPAKRAGKRKQEPRRRIAPDDGMTLIDKAKEVLGSRLKEDRYRGYLLDGRPVRTDAVIAAAGLDYPPEPTLAEKRQRALFIDAAW